MSSEISDRSADLPRETGAVVRNGGGSSDVPVHAGDNPTMSISELYERREQREAAGTSGEGAGASGEGAAADEDGRGSEVSAVTADESLDAGHPARESGYPADAGAPYEGVDGHGANAVIDGQVVSDPVTDSDPAPDEGTRGGGDSRFAGWPEVAAADAAGDGDAREGAAGGRDADGSPGFFGRAGEVQDQGEAGSGERDGSERAGPDTRSSADATRQGERREEAGGDKDAEGQEEGREQEPKDLAPVQHPAPDADAGTGRSGEVSAEAAPDQQPDDPRIAGMEARMERMMATVEAMQEKLEASEARHEEDRADLEQVIGDLQSKNSELEQKVSELEADRGERQAIRDRAPDSSDDREPQETDSVTEPVTRPDALGAGDEAGGEAADIIGRTNDESEVADGKISSAPDRINQAGAAGLGLAGQLGLVHPALSLALGGESARRAFAEMSPDEQYDAVNTMNGIVNAYGGMAPGTAFLAAVTSAYGPAVYSKARDTVHDLLHKMRRED